MSPADKAGELVAGRARAAELLSGRERGACVCSGACLCDPQPSRCRELIPAITSADGPDGSLRCELAAGHAGNHSAWGIEERGVYRFAIPVIWPVLVLAVLAAACGPARGPWSIVGDAPAAFGVELAAAVAAIGVDHAGIVYVQPEPFPCPAGRCAGFMLDPSHVAVAYAPALGLGPAPGTTALEHELCHAAGELAEGAASSCAARAMPAIRLALAGGAP